MSIYSSQLKMFWCRFMFLGAIASAYAVSRPSYILPCSRTQDFEQCALKSAVHAIPFLINGDRKLKIPNLNPLKIPQVNLNGANNFNLRMDNLEIYGLSDTIPIGINADFAKQKVRFTSKVAKITILGDYEISGKILVLPITGKGPLNMTLYDGIYQYDFEYKLENHNGKNYAKIVDSAYDYSLKKITFDFQNLFNGDRLLGPQMNKFMNENWELMNEDLKKPILETLLLFHNQILQRISLQVPYDELFLD